MMKAIIGEVKRVSSRAVKQRMPGEIWAEGGDFDAVDSRAHATRVLNYILTKQGPGAWTWSYREPLPLIEIELKIRQPVVNRTRGGARTPARRPRSAPA